MRTLGTWEGVGGPAWLVDFKDIDEELHFLRSMIDKYRQAPVIRNLAVKIITDYGCPQRDKKCQAIAVGSWVQDNIYYVHELPERFQTPEETLRLRAGDCDDSTSLICSLIESIGIPSMMVCMKVSGAPLGVDIPVWHNLMGSWAHIFPTARMASGGLLPLDSTLRFPVSNARNPIEWAQERGKSVTVKLA